MSNINVIALLDDPNAVIATGKRVFSKEESGALLSVLESSQRLKTLENNRESEIKEALVEARQQGYDDGLEQGRVQAQSELSAKLVALQQSNEATLKEVRKDIVAIALQVVRKVASGVAAEDLLIALANEAAAEHLPRQSVSLKVSPQHLDSVTQRIGQLKEQGTPTAIDNIVADSELNPADCVLETPNGHVCVDLETQLLAIEHGLMKGSARSDPAPALSQ